jgi:hypothetical protein
MNWLCKLGIHRWKPVKVFKSYYIEDGTRYWVTSWLGFLCHCGERKLKPDRSYPQTPGSTTDAYDWLNSKPEAKATVLELVKR